MKKILFLIFALALLSCKPRSNFQISSPNGKQKLVLSEKSGRILMTYLHDGDTIFKKSPIGLISDSKVTNNRGIVAIDEKSVDEIWASVLGKNKNIRNNYKEYTIHLQEKNSPLGTYDIVFRCYNDGFAFRYLVDDKTKETIRMEGERTLLNFAEDFSYWAYNEEQPNLGPLVIDSISRVIEKPMVLKLKEDFYMAIHEAEIIRYAPFIIKTEKPKNQISFNVSETNDQGIVKTSWRTIIVGKQAGDLLESNLLANLNEPCKIEDTSWIKPGKSVWDWRIWGYKAADGFEYELDTKTHKRLIDFASKNNIQYLLIDADWYGPEFNTESDPTVATRKGFNIEECMSYAKEHGVGVILYLNDVGAKKFGLDRVLKQFHEWGAIGVKYGFMKGSWEEKVRQTRKVAELCAKYKLMVDFHDHPVSPSGDDRSYPNIMAREFGHAQADAKRSYFPETAVSSALINMIAGPIDYTNGWFDLNNAQSRVRVFEEIPGTVAAEVAKLIVVHTGWMVLPDSPEEYMKKEDLFDCIRKMPAQFDSFKVLQGDINETISVARASGEDWFVGSLTNREGRDLEINLSFLPKGEVYQATIYSDTKDTHFLHQKETYKIEKQNVNTASKLKVTLAPGGGNAIYLKKI